MRRASGPTTVERLAGWAAELSPTDVPERVAQLSLAQRRSVLSGISASARDEAASRAVDAVTAWAGPGTAAVAGTDATAAVDDAAYAAAVRSVALDFDDYACFGHSGHSSVVVPVLLAVADGRSPDDPEVAVAQIAANEIALRLGGTCLIGPLNGQLWSFVHTAGAAVSGARMIGLDAVGTAHALAIALYQAPRPTVPGFMGPDTKVLTAAEPATLGLRAARLAAAGVTGPLDVLDHPQGFLSAFASAPLPALLGRLGEGWATETMSVKPYPGCAYIDTTVEALLALGPVDPEEVDAVTVDAGMLTTGMDALSEGYAERVPPTPVTVNFSIPWNVAIVLTAGRLTPAETSTGWLAENHHRLSDLARRITLRHSWSLTARTAAAFAPVLPPRAMTHGVGLLDLVRGLGAVRREHPALGLRPGGMFEAARSVRRQGGVARRGQLWDPEALHEFRMTFPARVTVRLRSGRELVNQVDTPRGAAGAGEGPEAVARERWDEWRDGVPEEWRPAGEHPAPLRDAGVAQGATRSSGGGQGA